MKWREGATGAAAAAAESEEAAVKMSHQEWRLMLFEWIAADTIQMSSRRIRKLQQCVWAHKS